MKVIWLCNMIPGAVGSRLGRRGTGGLWVDHVLSDLRQKDTVELLVLCPGGSESGQLDERTAYALFTEGEAYQYSGVLEERFVQILRSFRPDVIHIWGTEYGHTLAMVRAAQTGALSHRVVISIQGLCGIYARHYCEGLPASVCRGASLRDFLRQDHILAQQKKFLRRGRMEREALERTTHVIGRTQWDRAITGQINPKRRYHFCNETLREVFYEGRWAYDCCRKHRIFASSCVYPVKGFHYLLEAFAIVLSRYPDATLTVTGDSFFADSLKKRISQQYYFRYLERICKEKDLLDKIVFLGDLNAQQMKEAYLEANVFALPSTIENSPNSLGEAMLLGVPCVAADVGGVSDMIHPGEGYVYQSTAPYMLAHGIMEVFAQGSGAQLMGERAHHHARSTHDPKRNLDTLLQIYSQVAGEEG